MGSIARLRWLVVLTLLGPSIWASSLEAAELLDETTMAAVRGGGGLQGYRCAQVNGGDCQGKSTQCAIAGAGDKLFQQRGESAWRSCLARTGYQCYQGTGCQCTIYYYKDRGCTQPDGTACDIVPAEGCG